MQSPQSNTPSEPKPTPTRQDLGKKLVRAAREGDITQVRNLFDAKADLRITDNSGHTALMWLVQKISIPKEPTPEELGKIALLEQIIDTINSDDANGINQANSNDLNEPDKRGNDLNRQGFTALHYAIENAGAGMVQLLLRKKADWDLHNKNGYDALGIAIALGRSSSATALIEAKANPNKTYEISTAPWHTQTTALILAMKNAPDSLVDKLIAAQADVNFSSPYAGLSPLLHAVNKGSVIHVRKLIEAKAVVDQEGALATALNRGNHLMVNTLIELKAKIGRTDEVPTFPLRIAVSRGDAGMIQSLLDAKADPERHDPEDPPLLIAALQNKNSEKVVPLLLEAKATMTGDANPDALLKTAVEYNCWQLVTRLVEAKANADQSINGCSLLYFAARNNALELVEALIAAKANADGNADDSYPPLVGAWQNPPVNMQIIDTLIKGRASINKRVSVQKFPGTSGSCLLLAHAANLGHLNVVSRLLAAQADVNDDDDHYLDSPLMMTIRSVKQQPTVAAVAAALITARATINKPAKCRVSCLNLAATIGDGKIVKLLIENGAKVEDPQQYSSLAIAINKDHRIVATQLIEAKADITSAAVKKAVQECITHNKIDMVNALITANVDITQFSLSESLIFVAKNNNAAMMQRLLDAKISIDPIKDNLFETAITHNNPEIVVTLLAANATPKKYKCDGYKRTVLQWAAIKGHVQVVQQLQDKKSTIAGLNTTDARKKTALHLAINHHYGDLTRAKPLVATLLRAKANYQLKDADGRTALDWAKAEPIIQQIFFQVFQEVPVLAGLLKRTGGKQSEEAIAFKKGETNKPSPIYTLSQKADYDQNIFRLIFRLAGKPRLLPGRQAKRPRDDSGMSSSNSLSANSSSLSSSSSSATTVLRSLGSLSAAAHIPEQRAQLDASLPGASSHPSSASKRKRGEEALEGLSDSTKKPKSTSSSSSSSSSSSAATSVGKSLEGGVLAPRTTTHIAPGLATPDDPSASPTEGLPQSAQSSSPT